MNKELQEAWNDLAKAVSVVLVRWGPWGFLARLVIITTILEVVFVVIPWLAR